MLVLGIDADHNLIPNIYHKNNETDYLKWGKDLISICEPYIVGVKFQSAYFESIGLYGLKCLTKLIAFTKNKNLMVIMDAKRGDIGSTSIAYAKAYLEKRQGRGSEFESDFLTINPLMGEDSMQPFITIAKQNQKTIFILLETSNPGASMILKEKTSINQTISDKIATFINAEHEKMNIQTNKFGPIGCVIGATNLNAHIWRQKLPNSIFLMPGIGAQKGSWKTIKHCLTKNKSGVLIPISRGITSTSNKSHSTKEYLDEVKKNIINYHNAIQSEVLN